MSRRSPLFALPALALSIAAAFLFWRWLGASVTLPDAPGSELQCLSYTPSEPDNGAGAVPGWVSTERIESDLDILMLYTRCLRVYTPLGTTPRVVDGAARRGMRVLLGAWIGRDREQNEKEIAGALELAGRYPRAVPIIVVGNEVLLRREMSGTQLAELINGVRAESPVPVAYADVADFFEKNPAVADAAEILLVHLLPYWDDPRPPPAAVAVEQVIRRYEEFQQRFFDKTVVVGETGWPSKGRMRGPGKPSTLNEAAYIRGFARRADELGIAYNLIEAIDQPWKRQAEGTVGGYWGILDRDRKPKFPLHGAVSAWPTWRADLLLTAAIILVVGLAGLKRRRSWLEWIAWSALALATGLSLAFQWDFASATCLSAWDWIGCGIAAAATAVAAALIGVLLGSPSPRAPASLLELGRSLRAPLSALRAAPLRVAAFFALVMTAAAWTSITLAFAARYRDIPLAHFVLPAIAGCWWRIRARPALSGGRREEAMLAAIVLVCGLMQTETTNPESMAWLALCVLLAAPWIDSLRAELARVRALFTDARQAKQQAENT